MTRLRYKFNSETLLFEITRTSRRKKLLRVLRGFLFSILLAVAYFATYTHYFDTPHSLSIRRTNADLLVQYDLLNKRFQESENFLTQIQRRDNNVYRATFGLDIIPSSVRNAGFGGVDRYLHFEKSEHADVLVNSSKRLDILLKKAYIQSVSFDTIAVLALKTEQMAHCIPAIPPIGIGNGVRITDVFRMRIDPIFGDLRKHRGMDFGGPMGTPVIVTGDGVVIKTTYSLSNTSYGNNVLVDHGFGYRTRYAHLSTINVKEGQTLKRGEQVGTLGNTGKSTAPHLHYEVHYQGDEVDPLNYFDANLELEEYESILLNAQENKDFD